MFYGREADLNELLALWNKRISSLITCRGRRRIGKSTLIREFAQKSKARLIQLEGVRPRVGLSNEDELRHFSRMLAAQTEEMEAKVSALGRKRGVTLRTALVYSGELDAEVAASGYFNAIVDIEEVM